MNTHVQVAAWLRIVYSGLGLLGAMVVLVFAGGLAALVGSSGGQDAAAASWIVVFGAGLAAYIGLLSIPGLVAGWGMLTYRPWARILNIVLSILDLFSIPVGTALGAYSLWVMFHPETVALFEGSHTPGQYPTHF
jgi:hypothetical protein